MLETQQSFLVQVICLPKKTTVTVLVLTLVLLFMSGDIELNPGSNKTNYGCKFSVCHCNLNSLAADNFEKVELLEVFLGDFNAKSKTWFINNQSSKEGTQLESLTSLYGLTQLIAEPTHVLENSSSCIDLIFTNQPNLIMDSGVHPSLHSKCHHQVIYTKLNL